MDLEQADASLDSVYTPTQLVSQSTPQSFYRRKCSNSVKLGSSDLQRLRKINEQASDLSIQASEIIGKTLGFPETSPDFPAAKFTFTPAPGDTEDVLIDVITIDGDIIWVGCMQDPPGVSCPGPCPCE